MVNCPLCDAVIDAEEDELDEGDELTCEECGTHLTVTSTDPIEIQPASEDDEDDEDEDEDEDEDDYEEEDEDEEEEDEPY
jgi:alpha-aminoadipate carrier protein LysW